jgi:hypothetical protein
MLHDVHVTDRGTAWEGLDQVAVTPRSSAVSPVGRSRRPPLRLRRSRGPVLAGLDGGGAILQRRLRDVLVGSTVILVPAVALNLWVTVVVFNRLDSDDSPVPSFITDDTGSGIEDVAWFMATVFVSVVTAAVGYFCALILLGERFRTPISLGRALVRTLTHLPSILAAWVITHWWFPLMALLAVTSDVEALIALGFFLPFVAWFSSAATLMVVPAMVGERLGPFAAAKRNWRLVRLRYGVCLAFVLVATLLSGLLLTGIATMVPLLEATGFLEFGSAAWIVQGIMVQFAVLVVVPLIALGTAQVYVEIRIVGEGLDLAMDADTAFGPRSATGSAR